MELDFMIKLHEFLPTNGAITLIMSLLSRLGDHGLIWLVLGAFMLCFKRTRKQGLIMLISLGIAFVINDYILKGILARPRPIHQSSFLMDWFVATGSKVPLDFSLPSGHSVAAGVCCFVLLYFYKKRAILPLIIGLFIALSRIYMTAHFPTDVFCGLLFGILVGRYVTLAYQFKLPKIKDKILKARLKRKLTNTYHD